MAQQLKPPDKNRPTFFGINCRGFFVFLSITNVLQHLIIIALTIDDIHLCVQAAYSHESQIFAHMSETIRFYERMIMWIWTLVHLSISTTLDFRLYQTAASPNIGFLRGYAIYHATSLPLMLCWYLYGFTSILVKGSTLPFPRNMVTLLLPSHVAYRIYTSYIVYRYSKDIEYDLTMKSGYRQLTDEELQVFELGAQFENKKVEFGFESCYEMAKFQAYDRKAFEIDRKNLDFSESTTLGCGEYGCVLKAYWSIKGERKAVAVKTVDPEVSDIHQFLALLTEAKVMMCMGRHKNVIGLLGVCTDKIKERNLFIICELCDYGCLRTYLRSERNTFINLLNADISVHADELTSRVSTRDLVQWSYETACGMEFLASKQIVHGDLAARNLLLTYNKTVKITDFGLSRRLYNYSVYKKRHNVPLPWRWLALESLLDMNFSTSSDVWSFAITCWEIFELGSRPWPEFNTFTSDFIENLRDGHVPTKGDLCSEEIYDCLHSCWNREPASRPSFTFLKNFFNGEYNQLGIKSCK